MAGHIYGDDSLEEDFSLLDTVFSNLESLILSNNNLAQPSPSSQSTASSTTRPGNALITTPPIPLELRQNNPQDCSNLIIASVDRATVEISRTIIALNATFSQQLQQASISASNGIKSAQGSASSTIAVVVQSASIATSSAFSSVTVANLAVTNANLALTSAQSTITSVNLALTSVSLASSSDVLRLSSSLTLLQASIDSVQASASTAIAAAQSALASATESAAAQASSILASAASVTQAIPTSQLLPALQSSAILSLTPAQAVGIVVGAVATSILLSFTIYFLVIKMKRRERDSYLDEKDFETSPRKLPSRLSSTFRTGNAMVIKFNPPKSSNAPAPGRSALRRPRDFPVATLHSKNDISQTGIAEVDVYSRTPSFLAFTTEPLTSSFTEQKNISDRHRPVSTGSPTWPLVFNTAVTVDTNTATPLAPEQIREAPSARSLERVEIPATAPYSSPSAKEMFLGPYPKVAWEDRDRTTASWPPGEEIPIRIDRLSEQMSERIFDLGPFDKSIKESVPEETFAVLPIKKIDILLVEERDEISTPEGPARDIVSIEASRECVLEPAEDPNGSFEQSETEKPLESPTVGPSEQIPQQLTEVPGPDFLSAPAKENGQPRYSILPGFKPILHLIVQPNEDIDGKAGLLDDLTTPSLEVERPFSQLMEHSPTREFLPVGEDITPILSPMDDLAIQREISPSPLPWHSMFELAAAEAAPISPPDPDISIQRDPPLSRPLSAEPRELSPLRRNPIFQNIDYFLGDDETIVNPEKPTDETEADEGRERGRSMIRTSDIIEARFSKMARHDQGEKAMEQEVGKVEMERTDSPLRRNPVDPTMTRTDERDRTVSPLRRNPSGVGQISITPSEQPPLLNSLLHPIYTTSLAREVSPLRRNPRHQEKSSSLLASDPITTPGIASVPTSNAQFSQTLSKFQTLASQNPIDTIAASNEVTQRAIAGIFIPGSLREQAVRNLSKSRERGKSRVRGKQMGHMGE